MAFDPTNDVDVLARTLWGEARGEGRPGIEDVACVVMNRLAAARAWEAAHPNKPEWWGDTVPTICLSRYQFSCWNVDDPNRSKLLGLNTSDWTFARCLDVAAAAIAGNLVDRTGGATHYKVTTLPWPMSWGRPVPPTFVEGHHSFYIIH